jgi:hypothetical protein
LNLKTKMKKTTKKASVTSAPAKKTPAPARKSAAPAKRKPAVHTEPPATFISAKIDIGFGNHLYIRGDGPGLSWDHGLAMDCVGTDLWTVSVKNAATLVTFKLLVNDLTWSSGNDFTAEPGQSLTITPAF